MALKRWKIPKEDRAIAKILAEECSISEFVASILVNRGHSAYEEAMQFLSYDEDFQSPFDMKDMSKAVERIKHAVDNGEKICIYGDYDCDGVTSTAILFTYLNSIGADVTYYIPERDGEGYGLNKDAINSIANDNVNLIITVDNGITAIEEAKYMNELSMDLIITDHHQPNEEIPQAVAVINPHRVDCCSRFKQLAGVGVCFKLIAALEDGDYQTALEYFADIVAVGTIGDIVPLVDENRTIVKYGLQSLKMSNNIGLLALMEVAMINVDNLNSQTVAFSIVPRLNAAGRMGSASLAVKLLLSEDYDEALQIAKELDNLNKERQSKEIEIISDIETMISKDKSILDNRVLILKSNTWNHGIIGIACSKLVERYSKPVMLMTLEDGILRGSARSIGEFHLFKALSCNSEFLERYGGHKLAAGFSLKEENYNLFKNGIEEYAKQYHDFMPQNIINIDKELDANEITVEKIDELAILEPFGAKNETPVFLIKNAIVDGIFPLSNDKHLRLSLQSDHVNIQALYFGMSSDRFIYKKGNLVDIVVTATTNYYNGNCTVSLKIRDIRPSGFVEDKFFNAKAYYEKIKRKEEVSQKIISVSRPTRDDIAVVYKLLKAIDGYNNDIDCLYFQLMDKNINYCKLRIILDVLDEMNLIFVSPALNKITVNQFPKKVDLSDSVILNGLN